MADKMFGDTDVKLAGRLSLAGQHRHSPTAAASPMTPPMSTYDMPHYQSWQSELTVNGNGLGQCLKWTGGPVLLRGIESRRRRLSSICSCPAPARRPAPSPASRSRSPTGPTMANSTSVTRPMPRRLIAWPRHAASPRALRYTVDQRNAYLDTDDDPHPRHPGDHQPCQRGLQFRPLHLSWHHLFRPTTVCALTNATGVSLPLANAPHHQQNLPQADLDAGDGSRSVRQDHGLFHHAVGLSFGRHQFPSLNPSVDGRAAGKGDRL